MSISGGVGVVAVLGPGKAFGEIALQVRGQLSLFALKYCLCLPSINTRESQVRIASRRQKKLDRYKRAQQKWACKQAAVKAGAAAAQQVNSFTGRVPLEFDDADVLKWTQVTNHPSFLLSLFACLNYRDT